MNPTLSLYKRYVEVSEEVRVDRRSVERWYKKKKYVRDNFKLTHAKKMQRAKGGGRKLKYPEMDGSLKFHIYLFIIIYLFSLMNSCFCKYKGRASDFFRVLKIHIKIFLSNQVLFRKKIEAQRGALLFSCFRNSRLYF